MKKLGLIGGMGPVSTIDYYQKLVVGFQQDHPQSCPPIVIDSLDVFELLKLEEQNDQAKLFRQLETSIENLTAAGAEYAALTANTPHMIFEELQAASPIPLVSILDPVGEAIKDHQQKKWHF
ncbi:aspartate/glutamate racemase family protein [Liquorilactobacillus vini]|uniref:Aspartate racemase n=1 Tax=Liquorilactobacillus vini DSM 20605 TaxID=1133569 RepID=A0A0R2CCM4_9LACO|nr:aspartate/glutamate racemase family protein [Liquorilactobacillus vini]KRM85219.1 aspartate racemase [Liquorilactobacillus vini DSM 20605]